MDHARPCLENEPPAKRQRATTRRPPSSQESDFSGVVWLRVDSDTRVRTPGVLPPLREIQKLFPRHSSISPRMLRFDAFLEAFGLAPADVRGFVAQHPMGRCFCAFDDGATFSAFVDAINPWLNVLPRDDHGSVIISFGPRAAFPDSFPERLAERTWPAPPPPPKHAAQANPRPPSQNRRQCPQSSTTVSSSASQ